MKTVTQPGGVVTSYGYDAKGNLATVTDAEGHVTAYTYDDLGRLVKTVSPDTGTTRYAYTAAGKLHTKTLNDGQITTYDYDSLGRLTHIHYPDSTEDETYTYDQGINGNGRLTGRSGKGWTSGYEYNAVGQITSETRTVSGATFITRYTYDKSGALTAMTYPDGRTVTYTPNPNGQPLSAVTTKSGTNKTLAEDAAYKPFGPLSGFDMGNGMEVRKTFDQDYRLKTLAAGSVMNLSYIHYMNGMIREITNALDPARSQFFTYDDLGRLKTANGVYGRMAWTYDNVGNRLTESRNGITETYAYKTGTNIIEAVDGALDKTFTHDANGNIHNAVIQKTSASAPITSDYLYTSDGLRLKRSSNGLTTIYHYDLAGNLIGESGPDGGNFKAHVYFAGTRLATVAADGTVCYHHNNHLETPIMMTDDDGDVVWRADYKPFGQATVDSASTVVNDFRFPGQVFDKETGYHYNWNRYYDSETGRYITADPIGLDGGGNLYAYVLNNPIAFIDTNGLKRLSYQEIENLVISNNYSGQSNELIICQIYKESTFDPNAKNPGSTATGLMQVTKGAAQDAGYNHVDMFDPVINIKAGSKYLKIRIKWANGNVKEGLEGYGTGPGYANGILKCESCLKENKCLSDDCLKKVK